MKTAAPMMDHSARVRAHDVALLRELNKVAAHLLTERRRAWVEDAAHRLEIDDPDDDPAERNKLVPRGREVEKAAVLRHLPKRPPGRKAV